jgi:hypothetical protein
VSRAAFGCGSTGSEEELILIDKNFDFSPINSACWHVFRHLLLHQHDKHEQQNLYQGLFKYQSWSPPLQPLVLYETLLWACIDFNRGVHSYKHFTIARRFRLDQQTHWTSSVQLGEKCLWRSITNECYETLIHGCGCPVSHSGRNLGLYLYLGGTILDLHKVCQCKFCCLAWISGRHQCFGL